MTKTKKKAFASHCYKRFLIIIAKMSNKEHVHSDNGTFNKKKS